MKMRAKFVINEIVRTTGGEILKMSAVAANSYPADGQDDDNTYARWSPSASLELYVANPALWGAYKPG